MTKLGSNELPLRVAVVGSGPAGFYATEQLFRSSHSVKVDMFERLGAPYGLVRSGVAPDHAKLKEVIEVYSRIAENLNFTFLGNVNVGRDVTIDELKAAYHAIIFACGAESDRSLGIPGEGLPGSHAAAEIVGWYNGHPDYADRKFDFSTERAVIIGQGNVAADVARILAKDVSELAATDIAAHALDALAASQVREIYIIGRRGPAQAKFTAKELKEFDRLARANAIVESSELELNDASRIELEVASNSGARRNLNMFSQFSANEHISGKRRVVFLFLRSPVALLGSTRVQAIVLEHNALTGPPGGQSAIPTGRTEILQTGLVFRSIGYRGEPVSGVPFDDRNGTIPNDNGRVVIGGRVFPQLYAAGWIKRGPTGIIGTNRADAAETVALLLTDLPKLQTNDTKRGASEVRAIFSKRGIRCVSFVDWKIIDQAEIRRGIPKNKPREKFIEIQHMLDCLRTASGDRQVVS